jgi:hypothetical protein
LIAAGLEMVCRLARYRANHPSCTRCAAAMVNRVSPINNAVWTAVFMRVTSDTKIAQFKALYPGDAYVDWIAWDPYNRNTPWLSFSAMVTPFYDWLTDNGYGGKPFMLAEYGVVEDPANPAAKADWFTAAGQSLTDGEFPNLKVVVSYFDHPDTVASGNFIIASSSASVGRCAGQRGVGVEEGEEFADVDGFGQVGLCAGGDEALQLTGGGVGAEDGNRHVGGFGVGSKGLEHVDAVDVGQVQVEHDHRGFAGSGQFQAEPAVAGGQHAPAGAAA